MALTLSLAENVHTEDELRQFRRLTSQPYPPSAQRAVPSHNDNRYGTTPVGLCRITKTRNIDNAPPSQQSAS